VSSPQIGKTRCMGLSLCMSVSLVIVIMFLQLGGGGMLHFVLVLVSVMSNVSISFFLRLVHNVQCGDEGVWNGMSQ